MTVDRRRLWHPGLPKACASGLLNRRIPERRCRRRAAIRGLAGAVARLAEVHALGQALGEAADQMGHAVVLVALRIRQRGGRRARCSSGAGAADREASVGGGGGCRGAEGGGREG